MIPRHFCTQIARHNNTNGEVHFETIVVSDQCDICDLDNVTFWPLRPIVASEM